MNIISIIIAIILFSIIVIFHELGHFLLAKANGIKVNEFCLDLDQLFWNTKRRNKILYQTPSIWWSMYYGRRG